MPKTFPARVRVSVLTGSPSTSVREALVRIARFGPQDDLEDEDGLLAVALAGGTPIGYARAVPVESRADRWTLKAVTVVPQWRRKGVGTALVGACADELRSIGAQSLQEWTDEATRSFFAGLDKQK